MSKRIPLSLAAAAIVLAAGTAAAGTAYLPLATNQSIEGKQYRTIVWVTNPTDQSVQVELRFIPSMTDGTQTLEGPADETIFIGPRQTVPVSAGLGKIGMLELRTAGAVQYAGELHSFTAGGQRQSSTAVPVIDAISVLEAGETAHLLAFERQQAGSESNLGLVNLGEGEAACVIRGFRPDGSQINATATVGVPAMGHREFPDALGILGEPSIDGARFTVSCDQPFYSYGVLLSRIPDSTEFLAPAAGGDNALVDPNTGGDGEEGGNFVVRRTGQFFAARNGASKLEIAIPTPAGQFYRRGVVELDVRTAKINKVYTVTVGLLRPNPNRALYFGHFVRGDNKNGPVQKTILDVDHELSHDGPSGVWLPNANYHMRFVYDTAARNIELIVTRGGQVVERVTGRISNLDLGHDGQGMKLVFGIDGVAAEAYYPPIGWSFSNLVATLTP